MRFPNPTFWAGKRVFLTGHTGFKGTWLALWLQTMGAEVSGYALAPDTTPALFTLTDAAQGMAASTLVDIRDAAAVAAALAASQAEIVLHLAAQPLVRASYSDPLGTYATNVMGTAHVLEAARRTNHVKVVQVITTDKCYENREWLYPYRETDRLGGHDPYSNSKACAELVVSSYRACFMAEAGIHLASARAGNVIGGGDWAADRIVPDCIRALTASQAIAIRNPHAIRPWQHVLEPLAGYLVLAEAQYAGQANTDSGFNFGPEPSNVVSVGTLAEALVARWGSGVLQIATDPHAVHEAHILKLDISKARALLDWTPRWDFAKTIAQTADWYRRVLLTGESARAVCLEQIDCYTSSTGKP